MDLKLAKMNKGLQVTVLRNSMSAVLRNTLSAVFSLLLSSFVLHLAPYLLRLGSINNSNNNNTNNNNSPSLYE